MDEISIHVSYIFGNKQNSLEKEDISEGRGAWIQERPNRRPYKDQRGKLTHGN